MSHSLLVPLCSSLRCTLSGIRSPRNSTDLGGEKSNTDDTSNAIYQDQNPQSGGSAGKVYDLDAPGAKPTSADGNTYRVRTNYYAYATLLDGRPISTNYYYYVRASCKKTSSGLQFASDVAGDNQVGPNRPRAAKPPKPVAMTSTLPRSHIEKFQCEGKKRQS